jgi:hypothetical protein
MNLPLPTPGLPGRVRNWPRRLANAAVAVAVIAVAAATFVLSYSGVRAVAITGGVSPHLARVYPGVFDAVLVIACVVAVLLRDGRWWARAWAWVVVVVLLAAIGATDVVHAMGYTLRHRPTEGLVAAAPVAAVLLAFSLLLTLLRQSRTAAEASASRRAGKRPTDALPAIAAGAAPRLPAPPIALPAAGDAARPEVAVTREEPVLGGEPPTVVIPEVSEASDVAEAAETFEVFEASEASQAFQASEASETFQASQASEGIEAAHAPTEAHAPSEVVSSQPRWPRHDPRQAPPAIRYASTGLNQDDYWDADDDRQFAGQVYPDPSAEEEPAARGFDRGGEDDPSVGAASPVTQGPGFNRVRSTPTPPADDEE